MNPKCFRYRNLGCFVLGVSLADVAIPHISSMNRMCTLHIMALLSSPSAAVPSRLFNTPALCDGLPPIAVSALSALDTRTMVSTHRAHAVTAPSVSKCYLETLLLAREKEGEAAERFYA